MNVPLTGRPPRPVPLPTYECLKITVYHPAHHSPPQWIIQIPVSPTETSSTSFLFPAGVLYDMLQVLTDEEGKLFIVNTLPKLAPIQETDLGPVLDPNNMVDATTTSDLVYILRGDISYRYTIYRSFVHWPLPRSLPERWLPMLDAYAPISSFDAPSNSRSGRTANIITLDKACVVTGRTDVNALEFAHVVSIGGATSAVRHWVKTHLPAVHINDSDPRNAITLFSVFNGRGLDAAQFLFYPDTSNPGGKYLTVWTGMDLRQFGLRYNLTYANMPARISPWVVYARFAQNTFEMLAKAWPDPCLFRPESPSDDDGAGGDGDGGGGDGDGGGGDGDGGGGDGDDSDDADYEEKDHSKGKRGRGHKTNAVQQKKSKTKDTTSGQMTDQISRSESFEFNSRRPHGSTANATVNLRRDTSYASRPAPRRAIAAAESQVELPSERFAGPPDLDGRLNPGSLREQAKMYNRMVATGQRLPFDWDGPQPDREMIAEYLENNKSATDPGSARVGRMLDGYTSE
ncbi:hypothetical protein MKEN_01069500 [Mycena kentingensis (nom. inval.)]|nr:hypothetical protein MKEN_01069500 [Mycena kentingensis (nom. inval.)]